MRWSAVSEARAFDLASKQHGLITRVQLDGLGVSQRTVVRRTRAGTWERFFPGVFRLLPSASSGWHQRLLGVCLWLGDDVVVSHAAAAALWKLDGMEEQPIEVSTTRKVSAQAPEGVIIHRVRHLYREAVTHLDGIPVTQVARTLLDIAGVVATDTVDAALECALRRKDTTFKKLHRMIEKVKARGLNGLRVLQALLHQKDGGSPKDSEAERLFYRNVIQAFGLPRPVHNFKVRNDRGKVVAKVDAAYPELKIAIEIYSRKFHTSAEQIQKDMNRQNELVRAGFAPYIFWWEDIHSTPHLTAERIREAIAARSGAPLGFAD